MHAHCVHWSVAGAIGATMEQQLATCDRHRATPCAAHCGFMPRLLLYIQPRAQCSAHSSVLLPPALLVVGDLAIAYEPESAYGKMYSKQVPRSLSDSMSVFL
eukprot:scaffold310972_cov32-Tisochrysis_lutea.AAC.1